MSRKIFLAAASAAALALLLSGCLGMGGGSSMNGMDHAHMDHGGTAAPSPANRTAAAAPMTDRPEVIRQTEFTLTARPGTLEVEPGRTLPVWTFNNSVPGPEIRVKQGDKVKITLKNELPQPVSIHWHGLPVSIGMDGIPGVTQDAVQPGRSFTYELTANRPGTYWYHSHQDSVNQIDRGLYGAFIVEPKDDSATRDYTLMLDEWMSSSAPSSTEAGHMDMGGMDHSSMSGMDHSGMSGMEASQGHDMNLYDLLTVNGRTGTAIPPLPVKEGDRVRLRLINAGYKSHTLHLHGQKWKVTATDGGPVNAPQELSDTLLAIAPGERYDVEFTADRPGEWYLEDHGSEPGVKGMKVKLVYEGTGTASSDRPDDARTDLPVFDFTRYGEPAPAPFTLNQSYDVTYTMDLGTETRDGGTVYTINGKTFPDADPLQVKKGDRVMVRLVNRSKADQHPMHLHGHFFQVLSRNGTPLSGSPIVKDTLNLLPGEEYVVAFEADNPGDWMFHCHDLHHAAMGMVTDMRYTDYKSSYTPDPKAGNMPE